MDEITRKRLIKEAWKLLDKIEANVLDLIDRINRARKKAA
jgi:hypothetical protein